ncbi:MAG: hypothetical protein KME19_15295 [Microcoleus vaginatus WJT46-NPBG5]|jgi:hypothetical protein|nr:hypothetical protein [Microcoleus vaginatus WJT46-NPBG5]
MKRAILSSCLAFVLTAAIALIVGLAQPRLAAYDTGSFVATSHQLNLNAAKPNLSVNTLAAAKSLNSVRGSIAQAWLNHGEFSDALLLGNSSAGDSLKDQLRCGCAACTAGVSVAV